VQKHLLDNDLTREEFAGRVREVQDLSLDEFIAEQVATPTGRRFVAHGKWVQQLWPAEVEVTDADVRARYEAELAERFTQPEKVRASHILLLPDPQDEAGVLARAEELVALARAPEADFAALAREHSQGPSAPAGGDVGWFPREGAMVEEFAAAAFALEPGQVSDAVRTQFGFHVNRLTDKKPGRTIPFEEAADVLRYEIETERMTRSLTAHVDELRAKAEIKYP
jgi:parvulin-like peptidyl-prolyl isomerase